MLVYLLNDNLICVAAVLWPHVAKAEREVQSLWYVFVSINHLVCVSLWKWWIVAFVYHFGVRDSLQLILIFYRPSAVCRDQDGEWKVKGLWDSQIWLSRERWEGLQDDEWNQDQWPGGGCPHRSQRLKLWGGLANTFPHSALLPMIFCFVLKTQLHHISMCLLFLFIFVCLYTT